MSKTSDEAARLRQEIISQCIWSDTYSSLKHILKRTGHQLPLLISFLNTNDKQQTANEKCQTVFFFDRTVSNKTLLTPLQQRSNQPDQFNIHPKHCTFVITDLYKGLFEFVRNGQRCARIFTKLEQLIAFTSTFNSSSIVFISRDPCRGYSQETPSSKWLNKDYPAGAFFQAERIHRSSVPTNDGYRIPNDYMECRDENGYMIFIKLDQSGRFSILSTSVEQQENQPEIYVHSTQTSNLVQLIRRVTLDNNNKDNNNCIRLLRGSTPHRFHGQYFQLVRQHTHDVLVGLTEDNLVIEWNLDSHVPCRYATNLNDILDNIPGSALERILEPSIEQARIHYKDNFRKNMQLISTVDWTAFFQFWKWIGYLRRKDDVEKKIPYQSRHRFHIVASIQDLSSHSRALISAFKKHRNPSHDVLSLEENIPVENKKILLQKQRSFVSQMPTLVSTPTNSTRHRSEEPTKRNSQSSTFSLLSGRRPFDDSIYDSNQIRQFSSKDSLISRSTHRSKH